MNKMHESGSCVAGNAFGTSILKTEQFTSRRMKLSTRKSADVFKFMSKLSASLTEKCF